MKNVLARSNRTILRRFAAMHTLAAFDFDGTLAPIVAKPRDAAMRTRTRQRLARLAQWMPCAVISGRPRADVARRMRGVTLQAIVGNHGLGIAPAATTARAARRARRWRDILRHELAGIAGVVVEDNGLSTAVHYRQASDPEAARRTVMASVRALGPLRLIGGKMVVNLLPEGAPHKGTALAVLRRRLRCEAAIYVGDDVTDEDVFATQAADHRLLGIRVGRSRTSHARWYVEGQEQLDELMRVLAEERRKAAGAAR